jgi:hypothetical protein
MVWEARVPCQTGFISSGGIAMGLDIRMPIGLMFSVIGGLLITFGVVGPTDIYQRSLSLNVNLWWGGVLLVFGLVMMGLARRRRGRS